MIGVADTTESSTMTGDSPNQEWSRFETIAPEKNSGPVASNDAFRWELYDTLLEVWRLGILKQPSGMQSRIADKLVSWLHRAVEDDRALVVSEIVRDSTADRFVSQERIDAATDVLRFFPKEVMDAVDRLGATASIAWLVSSALCIPQAAGYERKRAETTLAKWLCHDDAAVREHAAQTIGRLELATLESTLRQQRQAERNEAVKDAIDDALDDLQPK